MSNAADNSESYLKAGKFKIGLRVVRNFILVLIVLTTGFGIGYRYKEYQDNRHAEQTYLARQASSVGNLDLSLFWKVLDILQAAYLDTDAIDPQELVYGAIKGMTSALDDPYTVFLPPSQNQQAKEDLNGAFGGVGIQLGYKQETLAVMTPLDEHPAIRKGVKAGDLIINIKDDAKDVDTDTVGMSLQEAVNIIRGPQGSPVTLTLYRADKGTFDVEIVRDTIVIPSVDMKIGDWQGTEFVEDAAGSIAWIKVRRFGDRTQEQWDEAVNEVISKNNQLEGVVLDLRNNPGGFLHGAISLASDFVPEGVIAKQEGRHESETYTVSRIGRLIGMPLTVLVNSGSASASEILAGALRDRLETPIVGEKSFGKGTVQEAIELEENAGLHVTTARWLLPSGDWIHEKGIEPDLAIEIDIPEDATDSAELVDSQLESAIDVLRNGLPEASEE